MTTILETGVTSVVSTGYTAPMQNTVTILKDGSYITAWWDGWTLYGRLFDAAGNPVADTFTLEATYPNPPIDPKVLAMTDGGFVLTWSSYNRGGVYQTAVFSQRFDAHGVKVGAETQVDSVMSGSAREPSLCALNDGRYVITWTDYSQEGSGNFQGVYSQMFDADGTAIGSKVHVNTYTKDDQFYPVIAALSSGGYVIVWTSYMQDGSYMGTYGQRYDATGNATGGEFHIGTSTQWDQFASSVTGLTDGGFVISWVSDDGTYSNGDDNFLQRYDANGIPVGDEILVKPGRVTDGTTVYGLADGGFLAIWGEYHPGMPFNADDDYVDIFAQRFDSSGARIGGELLVGTALKTSFPWCDVAVRDDGGFVISWVAGGEIYQAVYSASDGSDGENHLIYGTGGEDVIAGVSGVDTIYGGAGDDQISASGTVTVDDHTTGDSLYGEGGNDTLSGDIGDNVENGGAGDDLLYGRTGEGSTYWTTGAGADTLNGGDGNDGILGGGTAGHLARLNGDNGDDIISTGAYSDADGGAGDDLLQIDFYDYAQDNGHGITLDVSGGTAVYVMPGGGSVQGFEKFDITGTNFDDQLTDGNGDGKLYGKDGGDLLNGLGGNDYLDGGAGIDTMTGDLGDDTYIVDNAADVVTEGPGGGSDTVLASVSYVLGKTYIEVLTLTGTANLYAKGNSIDNALNGNDGNNRLDGNLGADTLTGGVGNDTLVVDNAGDVVVEAVGEGTDTVQASLSITLTANVENLLLTGTAALNGTGNAAGNALTGNSGNNWLSGLGGDDVLTGGLGLDTLVGGLGNDTYVADNAGDVVTELNSQGTDTVLASVSWTLGNASSIEVLTLTGPQHINATGNAFANVLNGNSGNNRLNGGSGADTLSGGGGHDLYIVENIGDVVIEGLNAGTDTVQSGVSFVLGDNVENLTLAGNGAINGTGNALANTIYGNAGNNVLAGGGGADKIYGRGGNDTYIVDTAAMGISELLGGGDAGGVDEVRASVSYSLKDYFENLILTGSANINGVGNGLANQLTGNSGNNLLTGGAGNDSLAGGLGADQFVFGAGSGVDIVSDFSAAQNDRINVHGLAHGVINGAGITLSQVGGDTVIDLGGGNMVTVVGALKADVQSHMVW